MPKTRRQKKAAVRFAASNGMNRGRVEHGAITRASAGISTGAVSMQSMMFSAMVALGFWGFAVFCLFFYPVDPNHYLYGSILALTALGWSLILVRRWSQYRRRVGEAG
jgi:hypothetical protein